MSLHSVWHSSILSRPDYDTHSYRFRFILLTNATDLRQIAACLNHANRCETILTCGEKCVPFNVARPIFLHAFFKWWWQFLVADVRLKNVVDFWILWGVGKVNRVELQSWFENQLRLCRIFPTFERRKQLYCYNLRLGSIPVDFWT